MLNKVLITFAIALLALTNLFAVAQEARTETDYEKEIQNYAKAFTKNNFDFHEEAVKTLEWKGHTSEKIFDQVEQRALATYQSKDKNIRKHAIVYLLGLSYSGNPKYIDTLNKISESATNKKVRKAAAESYVKLQQYQKWNPVIGSGTKTAPAGKINEVRQINMLLADDYTLNKFAAIEIYEQKAQNKTVVAVVHKRVSDEYQSINEFSDKFDVDVLSWFLKVLAQSRDPDHKELLVSVSENAKHKKLRKWASKYLDNF